MQSSEGKCKAQMSISYGGPVLWNLNEENEAEKDIFLVDGAPCWHLVRSVTSALLCSALTCNQSTSVVIYIYIAIVIVIIVVITKISIRPERWIVTIPLLDQWLATIGNHWKTIATNGFGDQKPLKNHC